MQTPFQRFRAYASDVLQAGAFDVRPDVEAAHLFHASLTTTQAHLAWTEGAVDGFGQTFKVVPGFLDIYTPNAVADQYKGCFFIGMHSALFVALTEFSMFCFAQADFFNDIGAPELEQSPSPINDRPPGLWLIDHTRRGLHVTDTHSAQVIPKCPLRYEMSIYLTLLMARFVWLHELAHCFNGHITLVRERQMALRLYEVAPPITAVEARSSEKVPLHQSILHALEYDADRSALWASVRIQADGLENIAGIAELDTDLRHRLVLFGSYAMTWLFAEFQQYGNTDHVITHPAPYLRLHALLKTAQDHMPGYINEFAGLNARACSEFDTIQRAIPGFYMSNDVMANPAEPALARALVSLSESLTQIRPDLDRMAFSNKDA